MELDLEPLKVGLKLVMLGLLPLGGFLLLLPLGCSILQVLFGLVLFELLELLLQGLLALLELFLLCFLMLGVLLLLLDALLEHLVDWLLFLFESLKLGPALSYGFKDLFQSVCCLDEGWAVSGWLFGNFQLYSD